MISIDEAFQLIDEKTGTLTAKTVSVSEALGCVLAEDVMSDIDSPPHDKAMMDGYAVVAEDLKLGNARLQVVEEVTAGAIPSVAISAGKATRIMTGAPVPDGADAVVMIERCTLSEDQQWVLIDDTTTTTGKNIMPQATSLAIDQVVLPKGTLIRPVEVGILSEVGRVEVSVFPRPSLAVLCTGNELVTPDQKPGPGAIRNSNGPMLAAQAQNAGAEVEYLGIGKDEEEELRSLINEGLKRDILVLSGGVSAGVLDLVPKLLAEQQVTQVFHKVSLKPGKPIWFGVKQHADKQTLVFGLPGNPVSSMVCFELFVKRAIQTLIGNPNQSLVMEDAVLGSEFQHRGNRPTLFPASVKKNDSGLLADPVNWKGSADLASLTFANALICFPAGDRLYHVGDRVKIHYL